MVCEKDEIFSVLQETRDHTYPQTTFSSSSHRLGKARRAVRTGHIHFYRSATRKEIPFKIVKTLERVICILLTQFI